MTAPIALVADIGGTNARFALVESGQLRPGRALTLQVSDYSGIESAIREYLRRSDVAGCPRQVCLAIACPVTRDRVSMTNNGWSFSKAQLRESLGLERLEVINDYAAQAYAIPHLHSDELTRVGGGEALPGQPLALLGPGTGLGVGGLVPSANGNVAVITEGGHVDFAPTSELEVDILRYLWKQHAHVSAERLLSGMGLTALHEAIAAIQGVPSEPLTPAQITESALQSGDSLCLQVLDCFCAILGSVAGNAALTLGAQGGVFITGGIIPRMLPFFAASSFRARFEAKGRFSPYMAAIPTSVVTAEQPGLLGSSAWLQDSDNRKEQL